MEWSKLSAEDWYLLVSIHGQKGLSIRGLSNMMGRSEEAIRGALAKIGNSKCPMLEKIRQDIAINGE